MEQAGINAPVFNVIDGQIRIAWFDNRQLIVENGQILLSIRMRLISSDISKIGTIPFEVNGECEVADGSALAYHFVSLTIPKLTLQTPHFEAGIIPNPFRDAAELRISMAESAFVDVFFYDVNGKLLKTPVEHQWFETGSFTLPIYREGLPAGTYQYKVYFRNDKTNKSLNGRFVISK
jgi:hypothetical protein